MKKLTTKEFIEKARKIHGDKYDYSKVNYINSRNKVCIVCPEHGEFWQTPNTHLDGCGCPKCYNETLRGSGTKLTREAFINRARKIHGDKYDYSKVAYKSIVDKVCIICPEHGEFWQAPSQHLRGNGCPKCSHRNYKKTTEEFIEEARQAHGDKYDYSKVKYDGQNVPVCIICPEHGEFWQTPKMHLKSKYSCPVCLSKNVGINKRLSLEEFIEKARKIHGDKYDYSKVNYITTDTKVCIICPDHGEFWQAPHNHITQKQGCPFCSESHLSKEVQEFLKSNNINFEREKKFEWLIYKKKLSLDFYLPDYNIAIECQGEQHFKPFRWETDEKRLEKRKLRDRIKKELCEKHGIKVMYYSFKKFNNEIITDINKLL